VQDPRRSRGQAAQEPTLARAGVRYYLEKRDPEFEPKMAEILCIYRRVAVLRERGQGAASAAEGTQGSQAIISYDEKPGIQAIGMTAPDRPPLPGTSPTVMRDHEYKRQAHPRQSFRPCLARDHELACRAADRAFYLHVHADPRVVAQSHRGLFLKAGAFGPAPRPRPLQTRTQRTPDGLDCRHQ
jgi:hypothetical protein